MAPPEDKIRPRVSVLMTIYNAEPYLSEAIDSIFMQTFSNWELIAVENGSTDQSKEILLTYDDPRVRVFAFPENIGRTPALRYAFEKARGEYIGVLDADDVALRERLARQVEFLDNHPEVILAGSWAQGIDETGCITSTLEPPTNSEELHDCLGWANPMVHSSVMYRSAAASKVGGYPEEFAYAQDIALMQILAQNGRLAIIDDFLCQWRTSTTSETRSSRNRLLIAYEQLALWRYAVQSLPLSARARHLNRLVTARAEVRYGLAMLRNKTVFSGFGNILRGLVRCPRLIWQNDRVRRSFGLPEEVYWWKRQIMPDHLQSR